MASFMMLFGWGWKLTNSKQDTEIQKYEEKEFIKEKLKKIPNSPGVYLMKDRHGGTLYIGKSKNLKSRVRTYFSKGEKPDKIVRMIHNLKDINFIVTDTHLEAQILECALIKKLKPIYNVQFKNHQNYFYIDIGHDIRKKPLLISFIRTDSNSYGPYRGKGMIYHILKQMENIYPIKRVGANFYFDFSIFPQKMKEQDFKENKLSLIEILSSEKGYTEFIEKTKEKMMNASNLSRFETAKAYRDIINGISYLYYNNLKAGYRYLDKPTVFGEKIEKGIKVFYIVSGVIVLKRVYEDIKDDDVKKFIEEGKALTKIRGESKDEKRSLDFRRIVSLELQDNEGKIIFL